MNKDNLLLRICKAIGKYYSLAEDIFMVVGMVVSGLCIMYDITVRAIGISGLAWVSEFSRYIYVLTIFIGSSKAMRAGSHMVMDLIHQVLPIKISMIVQLVTHIALGAFSFLLAYNSYKWTLKLKTMHRTWESLPQVPIYIVWVVVTICLVTMGFRAWARAVEFGGKLKEQRKLEIQQDVEL